jgi:hypothetical protein
MATEPIQTKLDEESVAKILAKFDIDKMMKFFIGLISVLGEVAVKLADIEEENKEIPEIIKVISANPRLFLTRILEKASGEEVKTLITAMLKMDELSTKLSNLFLLKPEEKRKIGEELITLSKEIDEGYKKAREKR